MADVGAAPVNADPKSKRQRILKRRQALYQVRSSRDTEFKEVIRFMVPRLGRFNKEDETRASSQYSAYRAILDSTGGHYHKVLSSGLQAGVSSPARPWLRLTIGDKVLADYQPVKLWLKQLTDLMLQIFAKSNTYRSLHACYEELGAFGTSLNLIVPDFQDVIRCHPCTIGEYSLALDDRGAVSTFVREFNLTVEQIMEKADRGDFELSGVSASVKDKYANGNYDALIPVVHMVEPRKQKDREYGRRDNKNKPYASYYVEAGGDGRDLCLSESGFDRLPALAPRWSVTSTDTWGWGPAMEAMGDIKQLQQEQLRKSQAIDYQTEPPINISSNQKASGVDRLPGGVTYSTGTISTMFETRLDLSNLLADIVDVRERLGRAFFVDLFMMLANDTRSNITAREIAERHEEKLLQLGPVLERLHDEMLSPLVDIVFERIISAGLMPPPPPELQGADLNIEFISVLAQAQRSVGIASIDRLLGTIGAIAQVKPEALDKLDADQTIDVYADLLGVDPSLIVSDENVAIIRADRAKQQQQAQQTQMAAMAAQTAASTAKDLGTVKLDENNAASAIAGQFSQFFGGAPRQ